MSADGDITAARHGGNPHSTAAAASIDKAAIRKRVLAVIASLDFGATSDEVEVITGLSHQTVSARMSELKRDGAVVPAGRRPTRSGRSAAVWVAAPVQQELWAG